MSTVLLERPGCGSPDIGDGNRRSRFLALLCLEAAGLGRTDSLLEPAVFQSLKKRSVQ